MHGNSICKEKAKLYIYLFKTKVDNISGVFFIIFYITQLRNNVQTAMNTLSFLHFTQMGVRQ